MQKDQTTIRFACLFYCPAPPPRSSINLFGRIGSRVNGILLIVSACLSIGQEAHGMSTGCNACCDGLHYRTLYCTHITSSRNCPLAPSRCADNDTLTRSYTSVQQHRHPFPTHILPTRSFPRSPNGDIRNYGIARTHANRRLVSTSNTAWPLRESLASLSRHYCPEPRYSLSPLCRYTICTPSLAVACHCFHKLELRHVPLERRKPPPSLTISKTGWFSTLPLFET